MVDRVAANLRAVERRDQDADREIVDELMIFFKHSAGELSVAPSSVDVFELVQRVVNAYSVVALTKNLRLEICSATNDRLAEVDPLHLRRILSLSLVLQSIVPRNFQFVLIFRVRAFRRTLLETGQ